MSHPNAATLHDYVDEELPELERVRVEDHLATCAACGAVVVAVRGLRDEAMSTFADGGGVGPANVPDQWREIEARIRALPESDSGDVIRLPVGDLPQGGPFQGRVWMRWAAAAVLLVGLSSSATYVLTKASAGPGSGPEAVTTAFRGEAEGSAGAAITAAYEPVFVELEGILDEGRGRLLPETVATLEENLLVLEAAIGEVRAALAADPADAGMLRSLGGIYQARVGLLRRAVDLTRGT